MAYSEDVTWSQAVERLTRHTQDIQRAVRDAKAAYDWFAAVYADQGATNADVATSMGRTTTEIANMLAAFAVFSDLDDCLGNVAVSQSDRNYSLNKFAG